MATFTLHVNRSRTSRPVHRRQAPPSRANRNFRHQFPTLRGFISDHQLAGVQHAPLGSWNSTLQVNNAAVTEFPKKYHRQPQKPVARSVQRVLECAYCHENHHIRDCVRAADGRARKEQKRRDAKNAQKAEKKRRAEERLRQQILAAQQAKMAAEAEKSASESEDSDSESEEESATDSKIAQLKQKINEKQALLDQATDWSVIGELEEEIEDLEEKLSALQDDE